MDMVREFSDPDRADASYVYVPKPVSCGIYALEESISHHYLLSLLAVGIPR